MVAFTVGSFGKEQREPNFFRQFGRAESLDPTMSDVVSTYIDEAFKGIGTLEADIRAKQVERANKEGEPIDEETYKNSFNFRPEVAWYAGMTRQASFILSQNRDEQIKRNFILGQASSSEKALGLVSSFGAGLFELKNAGLGIATAIVGGSIASRLIGMSRLAKIKARLGRYKSLAAVGGIEGLVSAAAAEPSNRRSAAILQQDYDMVDTLWNVGLSTVFSAILPVGIRGIADAPVIIKNKLGNKRFSDVLEEIDTATSQMAEGREIKTESVEFINKREFNPDQSKVYRIALNESAEGSVKSINSLLQLETIRRKPAVTRRINSLLEEIEDLSLERKVTSMSDHLIKKGGIGDDISVLAKRKEGLQQKEGMSIEQAIDEVMNAGFFEKRPTVKQFLTHLSDDIDGKRKFTRRLEEEAPEFIDKITDRMTKIEKEFVKAGLTLDQLGEFAGMKTDMAALKNVENARDKFSRVQQEQIRGLQDSIKSAVTTENSTAVEQTELESFRKSDERNAEFKPSEELQLIEATVEDLNRRGLLDEDSQAALDHIKVLEEKDNVIAALREAEVCLIR